MKVLENLIVVLICIMTASLAIGIVLFVKEEVATIRQERAELTPAQVEWVVECSQMKALRECEGDAIRMSERGWLK